MVLGGIHHDMHLGETQKLPSTPTGHDTIDYPNGVVACLIKLLGSDHLRNTLVDTSLDVLIFCFDKHDHRHLDRQLQGREAEQEVTDTAQSLRRVHIELNPGKEADTVLELSTHF